MKNKTFYSHGKLLLSGEYVVLDGAISLAVPTKYGQSLNVSPSQEHKFSWKSFDEPKDIWFEDNFGLDDSSTNDITQRLIKILNTAKILNPEFLKDSCGFNVETHLEFPKNWGLGTSSTLINNVAKWANVNAYKLLENTFGGSGYDIACAQNNTPITYKLNHNKPEIKTINFNPQFKEHIYFVHLNKKQNSRDGIKHYHKNKANIPSAINSINSITLKMIDCKLLEVFQNLITEHESIIANITKQTPIKDLLFADFNGAIKSLGAWGGDFIMVVSKNSPNDYFNTKGYKTVISYKHMVL